MSEVVLPSGAGANRPTPRASQPESRTRLLLHLIVHEIHREHEGTVLGMAWTVLQPLLLVGAFFFLFEVLRVSNSNVPHGSLGRVAVILSGLVPWWFFIRTFSQSLGTLSAHANLVRQINFPIEVLPFAVVGVNFIDFLVGIVPLLGLAFAEGWVSWQIVLLPPIVFLLTAFLVGLAALLSPLGAMLRDLRNLIPIVLRLGLWISPVLFLPGTVPERFQWVMYVNPLMYFIGLVRYSTLGSAFGTTSVALLPPAPMFGIAAAIAVVFSALGYVSWKYVRRVAVDHL